LVDTEETLAVVAMMRDYGYKRFKLVNQATHASCRLQQPPLEGDYAETTFTKHMSGPFGEELPGAWQTADEVERAYVATCRQQALRIAYSARGSVLGIPLARLHTPMMWAYNVAPVARLRAMYARARGVEVGGWFDIHAAL
jgi:hypothetical protein